ncbi:VTT domain-containing protein [Acidipropionibacterium timonense]|uniref:VTT domain-containing protein n=1 Tax=Acidipropionibacterium timonense TaxID=2161818 RepID=UPI001031B62F|nr:VTT domain-containing protein [Acidipropionibacterium timonense]
MPSPLLTLVPLLLPSWMDPQAIIQAAGAAALWIVALIVFAECGLAIFFMPGDSLLFALGMFAAVGVTSSTPLVHYGSKVSTLVLVNAVLIVAAVAGNVVGYWIGREVGPRLFRPRDGLAGRIFKPEYVDKTNEFFAKHGAMALILARFVPIVRTFVTMVSGVGRMDFRRFISYTAIGGVLWVLIAVQAGFFLGQIDVIRNNFEAALILIILVSVLPMVVEWWRGRRRDAAA